MQDLIKVKSASYIRYEELLVKKEELRKEAEKYGLLYEQIFDSLSKEVYAYRMDCVKKRKIISYCRSVLSTGSTVKQKELDSFIEKAMKDYQDTLDYLNDENGDKKDDNSNQTDKDKLKNAKNIYRQLAKQIHPDMNSDLKDDPNIIDLWNRTCIAYNCLNLEELEELQILTNKYLQATNRKFVEIDIPDINEKIFNINRAIYKITHSKPYIYKYIIEDEESINKKKEELTKELNDYKNYSDELEVDVKKYDSMIEKEK